MGRFLEGVDRASVINRTAGFLAVASVLGFFIAWGGLSETLSAVGAASGSIDASRVVVALLYVISVPFFAVAAYGLWRRKSWARIVTVAAISLGILISLTGSNFSYSNLIWILVSGAIIYFYLTDEGIQQELSS